jgi:alkanesulfonate monooxygenase SsuD/methylene tetrahydromethanopterin reductase-like flavin-dependent oxidoreductase (luciferase family)
LSLTFNAEYLRDHWRVMEEGAASAGRTCDRQDWRVIRDVFVADTDAEAKAWVRSSHWAGMWREQNLPLLTAFEWLPYVKHDAAVADADVDVDYLIDNLWIVGSPETVTQKLLDTYEVLGGFGTLVLNKYDYGDTPVAYRRSLELLATEVMPEVNRRLDARVASAVAPRSASPAR